MRGGLRAKQSALVLLGAVACRNLPSYSALRDAWVAAQGEENGGFGLQMWATVVNRDGVVCAVAFAGGNRGNQ